MCVADRKTGGGPATIVVEAAFFLLNRRCRDEWFTHL
ncbi:hypothetical protein SAMN05421790_106152 [Kroppenstedtia eburnea]|uniref:Uncharacterized protein n=1 Tax=Kroppenstedtia eburnea TaxID=714067 RepID=A0A1N7MJT1_9BACL|nr:hypothetical protein SAMN05421790_106152 [Kroppenstedtia eburnea]